jgi:hypothetical protein
VLVTAVIPLLGPEIDEGNEQGQTVGSEQARRRRQHLRPADFVADEGRAESGREGWPEGIMRQATSLARWPAAAVGSAQCRRTMQFAVAATP